mmetsp:Transcript_12984/g.39285  ORF Transcript_12984/g.39285 Transcript_12984/m.39285 type:complete len:364 (-) Transcript_12984:451-1542(-)
MGLPEGPKGGATMELNPHLLRLMGQGRVFKDNQGRINSLAFHRSEDLMVTAGDDDSIHLYNLLSGSMEKVLMSKKHGVAHVAFTHHPQNVVYASRKGTEHLLRYLSLHDNQYVRYFRGHTARVTGITMSPKNDLFMSAAEDKEVRLWDLRVNACQGVVKCPAQPSAAFDEQGLVFAVAADSGIIKLYDVRSYDKGPFATFAIAELTNSANTFGSVSFSANGGRLLAVAGRSLFVLDAFEGTVMARHSTGGASGAPPYQASFSPDSQYVTSGCEDRVVRHWDTTTGLEVAEMTGHAGVPAVVAWAPRRLLLATACDALSMWVPNIQPQAPAPPPGPQRAGYLQQQQQHSKQPFHQQHLQPSKAY